MLFSRVIYFFILLSAVVFFAACEREHLNHPDVIILQTGRIRGNVYPLDLQNISPLQHYPYLAAYIKKIRKEAKEIGAEVLLIDSGDSLDGSFASFATQDRNMVTFFNALDYDVIALGNLDHSVPTALLSELNARVITPFTDAEGRPIPSNAKFGAALQKGDISIKIVANFYGDTRPEEFPMRFPVFFGENAAPSKPLRDYSSLEILATKDDDELRLLSWMKFESPEERPVDFLNQLTKMQVDAILAHRIYSGKQAETWNPQSNLDFQRWSPPVAQNILRNNGGFALARTDLKASNRGWEVLNSQVIPMTSNTAEADPEIIQKIDKFQKNITSQNAAIGNLPAPLAAPDILKLYMQALADVPNTDAVASSVNSIRCDWPKGELYSSTVFNSLPWTSDLVQLTLTAEEFQKLAQTSPDISFWKKDHPAGKEEPITLTTSKFYASLFHQSLGLPHDRLHVLKGQSEFGLFNKFLMKAFQKTDFQILKNIPDGWHKLSFQNDRKL
ncbi:MAG: hypothetical protein ACK5LK_03620 [Chthoniobacterales bacterium]